ncbi:Predicted DNA binding protein, contains HTH domain [Halopenitus malekzadehii]|uniref:Predicted DNA binding protein, contains HTH domain n=1 Tax=Halopenitus malekzadehii TaxID=1267564 RepID=A0A1H6I1B2_9EURY|nr:helix-turn-helix domain-containing protein [Halopenitus malekzadehii]SEH41835.1 Predicted DNA binding protein, contains HTH domain [Halopenitus malekzadehii]
MGLIAEFIVDTPILRQVMAEVPDMKIQNPVIYPETNGEYKSMIWAWGDDFQCFEEVMDENQFICEYSTLTQVGKRRLYLVTLGNGAEDHLAYQVVWDNDILTFHMTGTKKGFEMRALFPNKDSLSDFRKDCLARDIPFRLCALYQEDKFSDKNKKNSQPLTGKQRETLLIALEQGYFDVPRDTTLKGLADQLGISTQAVSTRLRRAQQRLIRASFERDTSANRV